MNHSERLKFMRNWLKDLENTCPEETKKVGCLSWAIKQCQKNVDRKRDKDKRYW